MFLADWKATLPWEKEYEMEVKVDPNVLRDSHLTDTPCFREHHYNFILFYRPNVIWKINRTVKVKTNSGRKEDTGSACHRARERSCHLQGLLIQLPLCYSLKLYYYSCGSWSTNTSPWHISLSRVLLIYSHSLYVLPTPGSAASTLTWEKAWKLKILQISGNTEDIANWSQSLLSQQFKLPFTSYEHWCM